MEGQRLGRPLPDDGLRLRDRLTIAPISSTRRGIPVEVVLGESDGLDHECVVNLDNPASIARRLLVDRICQLSEGRMHQVREAIMVALDL